MVDGKDSLQHGRIYEDEEMWENLEYWIKIITPIAEEEGIRLGIHPCDPPVPMLGGAAMLFRSFDAYKRLIEIYPSDSNAIEFCQGTFSEMNEDIYEMIRYFGERKKYYMSILEMFLLKFQNFKKNLSILVMWICIKQWKYIMKLGLMVYL